MNPDAVKSTLTNLAFGNVIVAAARNYQKDPELEKLHADRIAAFKKEAEKREAWKKKGHGEYREVTEGDFLGEVTRSEKVICHFYHKEFYRCKIMDKHLKSLSSKHIDTKFIRLDAEGGQHEYLYRDT
ncbi:Thioredoxin domain-containing protein plp3a [Trifolium repens]|nr:Thioredoxin domain-containing protein plp3a [Trifolium repens]